MSAAVTAYLMRDAGLISRAETACLVLMHQYLLKLRRNPQDLPFWTKYENSQELQVARSNTPALTWCTVQGGFAPEVERRYHHRARMS